MRLLEPATTLAQTGSHRGSLANGMAVEQPVNGSSSPPKARVTLMALELSTRSRPLGNFPKGQAAQVVEWLFAWLSRYRRLNIVYDCAADLFAGHIWIAMTSIIARRFVAQTQTPQRI